MAATGRFGDLAPRVASAVVLIVVGAAALWAGGRPFAALVALGAGAMIFEIAGLLSREEATPGSGRVRGVALGVAGALGLIAAIEIGGAAAPPLLVVTPFLAALLLPRARLAALAYGLLVMLGAWMLARLRIDLGILWALWLLAVVVACDIAGYFAGKTLGGRKLMPSVSPGKTWSGTIAGWLAAALVGLGFAFVLPGGTWLVLISIAVAMAGQAGDLLQSAAKRQAGAKDSSRLIPGHGGVWDRFDALTAAGVFVLGLTLVRLFPPVGP